MRTAAACFVLAAAIATPGIVVAATHSTAPQQHVTFGSGSAQFHPMYLVSNDPQLRSAVAAIQHALRARGEKGLQTIWGDGEAEIMQVGGAAMNPCPVQVKVHIVKPHDLQMWIGAAGCSDNTIRRGKLSVRYSPLSLGSAIRGALRTLH